MLFYLHFAPFPSLKIGSVDMRSVFFSLEVYRFVSVIDFQSFTIETSRFFVQKIGKTQSKHIFYIKFVYCMKNLSRLPRLKTSRLSFSAVRLYGVF